MQAFNPLTASRQGQGPVPAAKPPVGATMLQSNTTAEAARRGPAPTDYMTGVGITAPAAGSTGPRIFLITADSPKVQIIEVTM